MTGGSTLVTSEILFIFAILVLGIIAGLVAVRQALISELTESAQALLAINQSFSFSGQSNCEAITAGSSASDITNTHQRVQRQRQQRRNHQPDPLRLSRGTADTTGRPCAARARPFRVPAHRAAMARRPPAGVAWQGSYCSRNRVRGPTVS